MYDYIEENWRISKDDLKTSRLNLEDCFTRIEEQLNRAVLDNDFERIKQLQKVKHALISIFINILNEFEKQSLESSEEILYLGRYLYENKPDIITTKNRLTKDKSSLPKTRQSALPKTEEGVVEKALAAILDFHRRGIEPLTQEIAEAVGVESRPLGRLMAAAAVQAIKCHRGGVQGRRYTFELKEKIEKLLAKED